MLSFHIIPATDIDSTNNHLKKLHNQGSLPEGTVILAGYQSKGKGRGENSWYAGRNLNVLMSILLFPGIQVRDFFFLTEMASLALLDMLQEINIHGEIKWPNDIYANDKKIAGILIENTLISDRIDTSIIGIGLNVNEEKFPSELPNAISVKHITGKEFDKDILANMLLEKIDARYEEMAAGRFANMHNAYNSRLFRKNRQCQFTFRGRQFGAYPQSVLETGEILLTTEQGDQKQFSFGDLDMII